MCVHVIGVCVAAVAIHVPVLTVDGKEVAWRVSGSREDEDDNGCADIMLLLCD